jgi:hypothetical protein
LKEIAGSMNQLIEIMRDPNILDGRITELLALFHEGMHYLFTVAIVCIMAYVFIQICHMIERYNTHKPKRQ